MSLRVLLPLLCAAAVLVAAAIPDVLWPATIVLALAVGVLLYVSLRRTTLPDVAEALAAGYYFNFVAPLRRVGGGAVRLRWDGEERTFPAREVVLRVVVPEALGATLESAVREVRTANVPAELFIEGERTIGVAVAPGVGGAEIVDVPTTLRVLEMRAGSEREQAAALARFRRYLARYVEAEVPEAGVRVVLA